MNKSRAKRRILEVTSSSSSDDDDDVRDPDFVPQMKKSLKKSLAEYTEREKIAHLHLNRLKVLLKSANCEIVRVPQDGDCLFTATVQQLEDRLLTPTILRNMVAMHVLRQFDTYKGYLDGMTYKEYCKQVWRMKQPGNWNTRIADIIPNAVSNIFRREIKIYSSSDQLPFVHIFPGSTTENAAPLMFALTAIRGREHYDICRPIADKAEKEAGKEKRDTRSRITQPSVRKGKLCGDEREREKRENDDKRRLGESEPEKKKSKTGNHVKEDNNTRQTEKQTGCDITAPESTQNVTEIVGDKMTHNGELRKHDVMATNREENVFENEGETASQREHQVGHDNITVTQSTNEVLEKDDDTRQHVNTTEHSVNATESEESVDERKRDTPIQSENDENDICDDKKQSSAEAEDGLSTTENGNDWKVNEGDKTSQCENDISQDVTPTKSGHNVAENEYQDISRQDSHHAGHHEKETDSEGKRENVKETDGVKSGERQGSLGIEDEVSIDISENEHEKTAGSATANTTESTEHTYDNETDCRDFPDHRTEENETGEYDGRSEVDDNEKENESSESETGTNADNSEGEIEADEQIHDTSDTGENGAGHQPRRKRKRKRKWNQELRKDCRQKGETYITKTGKTVHARSVREYQCKCKFNCNEIDENARQALFDEYWALGTYERQRDFILKHVAHKQSSLCTGARRERSSIREYHIMSKEAKKRVCKSFFMSTLDIGKKVIDFAIRKQQEGGTILPDQRGRHQTSTKIPEDQAQFVHDHIRSFPTMLSHYCRKDTSKQYLDSTLSVSRMYNLYEEKCRESNISPVKLHFYRQQFKMYNLSFHKKTKDQCAKCAKFQNTENPNTDDEAEYNKHMNNKSISREEKHKDKELAKNDARFSSATFDLQSILVSPCTNVSNLYYSRKLHTYNLSVYTQESGNGTCFVWHEYNGKRGSNEIGSCIFKYAHSFGEDSPVRELSMFSDSCAGQNRNQFTMAALVYSVQSTVLDVMHLKFLETGHTQMEVDSIHAVIERRKKAVEIQIPDDWLNVIRSARASRPYVVDELSYSDFLDFKKYSKEIIRTAKIDSNGNKIKWNDIRWLKYDTSSPDVIFYNYSFAARDFKMIKLGGHTRSSGQLESSEPPPCYEAPTPVSVLKKKDLLQLCQKRLIKPQHHQFYADLTTDETVVDRLPEPDVDELV